MLSTPYHRTGKRVHYRRAFISQVVYTKRLQSMYHYYYQFFVDFYDQALYSI